MRDRVLGVTERVSADASGGQSDDNGPDLAGQISRDGYSFLFESGATNLIGEGNDTNEVSDVFIREPDRLDPLGADVFADGVLDDTVLEEFDATCGFSSSTIGSPDGATLCPATQTAVLDGMAAFLQTGVGERHQRLSRRSTGNFQRSKRIRTRLAVMAPALLMSGGK